MLSESYERMQLDVNASHILIALDANANTNDQKVAYDKALKIRKSIISGLISFSEAAKANSDDKSAVTNSGNLGYFTAFMMVYNFETAAYNTKIGDISLPTKTKFGYHLIKVNDRRDAVGKVKVAHIMFKTGQGADKNKINEAKDKIYEAMGFLNDGGDFSDIAERFSEDRATAVKGGSLPEFGVRKMVPEFEAAAFSLNNIGDISEPFLTDYGWHIIKLLKKTPIGSFSEIESDLKRKIENDSRSELGQQALYEKLKKSYKVINNPAEYSAFRKSASLKVSEGKFLLKTENNSTLLTIDGVSVSVNNFCNYILDNQSKGSDIDKMYLDFVNEQLVAYEDSKLEDKYADYKSLLNEYREGILLFDLTNKKVWRKAVEDTNALQSFFIENQSDYTWPDRVDATIYTCIDLATAIKVKQNMHKKKRGRITDSEILNKINIESPLSLQINSNKFSRGENEYIDIIDWKLGMAKDIVLKDNTYVLIHIHKVVPARFKFLDETKGKVISDYQNQLEKDWISNLKLKYSIKVDFEVLHSLVK
jgi:peptidyl-prolyl cis-trans isomerase SurA